MMFINECLECNMFDEIAEILANNLSRYIIVDFQILLT